MNWYKTAQQQAQFEAVSKDTHYSIDDLQKEINRTDPTPNNKYGKWILRAIKRREMVPGQDTRIVRDVLTRFDTFKKRKNIDFEKNIMAYHTYSALWRKMEELTETYGTDSERAAQEKARSGEIVKYDGTTHMGEHNGIEIVRMEEPDAVAKMCTNSGWCVADEDTASQYLKEGPLYLVYNQRQRFGLYHPASNEFLAEGNQEIDLNDPDAPDVPYAMVHLGVAKDLLDNGTPGDMVNFMERFGWRVPEMEAEVAKSPDDAVTFAENVLKSRWPEAEPMIAQHPGASIAYVIRVLNGQLFPAGEPAMSKDAEAAYLYAHRIKGPWPEAEPAIAQHYYYAMHYAERVLKGRFPLAEQKIASHPMTAANYAANVLKGPWPEAEPMIAQEPQAAVYYVDKANGGQRLLAAEPTIARDPEMAVNYAVSIGQRFPEGEPAIATKLWTSLRYARELKMRFPLGEEKIVERGERDMDVIRAYVSGVLVPYSTPEEVATSVHYLLRGEYKQQMERENRLRPTIDQLQQNADEASAWQSQKTAPPAVQLPTDQPQSGQAIASNWFHQIK